VTEPRAPRDAQRSRVYRAETPLPSSPLPGLAACATFADRVVGSLWWQARFPDLGLGGVPRLRPGNGARQAFFREDADGPTITLPRRYRTKGVVLHELTHWALHRDVDLPHHGRTFTRVLVDATLEFCGPERADALTASFRTFRVRVGRPARAAPDGRPHYGWDERLHLGRGRTLTIRSRADHGWETATTGTFEGYERGSSVIRLRDPAGGAYRVVANTVFAVEPVEGVGARA
jgi:putative metallohydrolase (TIGR04338 family)